jgi:hypothetical protein
MGVLFITGVHVTQPDFEDRSIPHSMSVETTPFPSPIHGPPVFPEPQHLHSELAKLDSTPDSRRRHVDRSTRTSQNAVRRGMLSPERQTVLQHTNTVHHVLQRSALSPEQRAEIQHADTVHHVLQRDELSPEQRAEIQHADTVHHVLQRSALSPEQRAEIQQANTEQHAYQRDALRQSETMAQYAERTAQDALRKRFHRAEESPEQQLQRRTQANLTSKKRESEQTGFVNTTIDELQGIPTAIKNLMDIGRRTPRCEHCNALLWEKERFTLCCSKGAIDNHLLIPLETPPVLKELYTSDARDAKQFREHIRTYNSGLAMVSMKVKQKTLAATGPPVYIIHGLMTRRHGSLLPTDAADAFLQSYLYDSRDTMRPNDPDSEAERRLVGMPNKKNIDKRTLLTLQQMLHKNHPFVKHLQSCIDVAQGKQLPHYNIVIVDNAYPASYHNGAYNAPVADEVACFTFGEQEASSSRDMVIRYAYRPCV